MNINTKRSLSRLSSDNSERSNISKKNNIHKMSVSKRTTIQFDEIKMDGKMSPIKSTKKIQSYAISPRKEKEENKKSKKIFSSSINKQRNSIKKRQGKRNESNREKEKNFYHQIIEKKSMKKRRSNTFGEKLEKEPKNNKMN